MAQEQHVADKIRQSFRHVDLVFGPHVLWKFPEFIHTLLTSRGRIFQIPDEAGSIAEGIPVVRQDKVKAWVSIMYGCNNFCSYCIVPYVRGRERSRKPEDIFGKDLDEPMDFADLLEQVNAVPGDFLIRFMTSHPKDATQKLFETMARCEKVAPVLHLPFQAGNDRVLKVMNRKHTIEQYLDKIRALRALIPNIVLTSDVIVGFPGETTPEFEDTLKVLEEVRFDALFTFIYSPRVGTPAAKMDDPMSGGPPGLHFRGKARRLHRQNHALSGGRGERRQPVPPLRPHPGQPVGAAHRKSRCDRTVCTGEDHRRQ